MTDIVERLHEENAFHFPICGEAAAEITALREKLARVELERDEALPWKMFYGDDKNLGEIAEHFGKSIYAFSPWLTAPLTRAILDATSKPQARVEKLEEALRAISNMPDIDGALDDSGYQRRAKHDLQSIARSALAADGENNARD